MEPPVKIRWLFGERFMKRGSRVQVPFSKELLVPFANGRGNDLSNLVHDDRGRNGWRVRQHDRQ